MLNKHINKHYNLDTVRYRKHTLYIFITNINFLPIFCMLNGWRNKFAIKSFRVCVGSHTNKPLDSLIDGEIHFIACLCSCDIFLYRTDCQWIKDSFDFGVEICSLFDDFFFVSICTYKVVVRHFLLFLRDFKRTIIMHWVSKENTQVFEI